MSAGQDAYEARREAERRKVERERATEEMQLTAIEMLTALLAGKASIKVVRVSNGYSIRLVRDP